MSELLPRIMVVDDDEAFRNCLKTTLEEEGCEVFLAFDGLDALEKIAQVKPDVITLDLMMPRMNGIEFLEKLQGMPEFEKTPVIIASCAGQPGFLRSVGPDEIKLKTQSEELLRQRGIKHPWIIPKQKKRLFFAEEKSIPTIVKRVKGALYEMEGRKKIDPS